MKLLLIHGRAQEGKDPIKLQLEWEEAFRAGGGKCPDGVEVVFPFYGDDLDHMVKELEAPLTSDIVARGGATEVRELQFRAEIYTEMAKGYAIPDAEIETNFAGQAQEKGPLNWKWVHALLKTLDRTPLGATAIDRFTRDVYVYLTYPKVRRTIDKIVSDKLNPGRWVVVGHSLGSVVGYNVLCALGGPAGVDVARYITVGSPLAVRPIRDRLASPLRMPPCVRTWYNAFDPRDVVALYPLDAHNFAIEPPIENKGTVDNFTDNRHGIGGYLTDRDVARKISEALRA